MTDRPPLWDHQRKALDQVVGLIGDGGGCLLDAYMGTGKTRMALDLIHERRYSRVLVLSPLSVVPVWASQAAQWTPDIDVLALHKGSCKARAAKVSEFLARGSRLLIATNYDAAWRGELGDVLRSIDLDLLIFDESHKIKAPGGKASKWCGRLAAGAERRLALTGTPMPHSPLDVYGQFRAIDVSVFGSSFVRFRGRYAVMGGFENRQIVGFQNEDEFKRKLASRTVHVERTVLDLLPATHTDISVEMPAAARKVYDTLKAEMVAQIDAGEITASNAMTKLLRLQQISGGHIQLDDEDTPRHLHGAKAAALIDLLDGLPKDEPVVVFARFRYDLDQIAEAADRTGRPCFELSGRCNNLDEWQRHGGVLAVQIQAGGVGIDLTVAAYCVYWSVGYSLGDYEQSLARVHRPGQERHVNYYHLVTEGTVDQAVYSSLRAKGKVIEDVMGSLRRRAQQPANKE